MKLFLIFIVSSTLWSTVIAPKKSIGTSTPVLDMVVREGKIWASTDGGDILQIDVRGKILNKISLKPFINSWGEKTIPKAMSLDISPDGKISVVASEEGKLYLIRGREMKISSYQTRSIIKKVAFISNTQVILALISNEIVWFDLVANKVIATLSGGTSPLSDMALSSDRKIAMIGGEAGVVTLIDTVKMKIIRQISGGNVDNIYKLDTQNGYIVTAGQDRRAIVYTVDGKHYVRYNGSFLIYSASLSPRANRMAAAMDEQNAISIFDTHSHQRIALAQGHNATLNRIVFIDEKRFVSCADENKILYWELP
jgi:WD40 repeat protein